jgi:hypothetical protein
LPTEGWSKDLIAICRVSEFLSPSKFRDTTELQTQLRAACDLRPRHPMSRLVQCNIALCIYRRLRVLGHRIPPDLIERLLESVDKAIDTTEELLHIGSPWWHVANVPFQAVYALLAIDTQESCGRLKSCLRTVKSVGEKYGTTPAREAFLASRILVTIRRNRKKEKISLLDNTLAEVDDNLVLEADAALPESNPAHHTLFSQPNGIPTLDELQLNEIFAMSYHSSFG